MFGQYAGQGKVLDSLISDLNNFPAPDTFRLNALMAVLNKSVLNATPQKAEKYYPEAQSLAKKLKECTETGRCYQFAGMLHSGKKEYEIALVYYDSAINAYSQCDTFEKEKGIAAVNQVKSNMYNRLGDKYAELQCLLEALKYYEKAGSENAIGLCELISVLYSNLSNSDKSLEYAEKEVKLAEATGRENLLIQANLRYVESLIDAKDAEKAFFYLDKTRPLIIKSDNDYYTYNYYSLTGLLYQLRKEYSSADENFLKALEYAEKTGHAVIISYVLGQLNTNSFQIAGWRKSKPYLDRHLLLAKETGNAPEERSALRNLSEYYKRTGDYKKSQEYGEESLVVNDSMLLQSNREQLNQLEARYQFEKKESEIQQLQKDKQIQALSLKNRSTFNYILGGAILAILIIGFLFFRNYRHKQKIQSQQIRELEKDKQLAVADSILKGQEEERERIAKDLHDGLGGLLSGVKLSFANVKSNMIKTGENIERFEQSLGLLDTSINELRRVAHNMMPEALLKSGMIVAINDYCKSINASSDLKVTSQSYGTEKKLDNSVSLIIYRIIQELMNNVIKHAHATEMLVQVMYRASSVNLTVEDNGKGFDVLQLAATEGAGWKNIKSRVDYLKGIIDVKSEPGKGTSVNIEINI
jgi:signal transduction histidine kinase